MLTRFEWLFKFLFTKELFINILCKRNIKGSTSWLAISTCSSESLFLNSPISRKVSHHHMKSPMLENSLVLNLNVSTSTTKVCGNDDCSFIIKRLGKRIVIIIVIIQLNQTVAFLIFVFFCFNLGFLRLFSCLFRILLILVVFLSLFYDMLLRELFNE